MERFWYSATGDKELRSRWTVSELDGLHNFIRPHLTSGGNHADEARQVCGMILSCKATFAVNPQQGSETARQYDEKVLRDIIAAIISFTSSSSSSSSLSSSSSSTTTTGLDCSDMVMGHRVVARIKLMETIFGVERALSYAKGLLPAMEQQAPVRVFLIFVDVLSCLVVQLLPNTKSGREIVQNERLIEAIGWREKAIGLATSNGLEGLVVSSENTAVG